MPLRLTMAVPRRVVLPLYWIGSVVLASGLGFGLGRVEPLGALLLRGGGPPSAPAAPPSETRAALEPPREPPPLAVELAASVPVAATPDLAPASPVAAPAPAVPLPPKPRTRPEPPPPVAPAPEPPPEAPALDLATIEPPPAPPSGPTPLERAVRTDRLAANGAKDDARAEAQALLADLPSSTELIAAFVAEGADPTRAHLNALRVLQLAGHAALSEDLARELRRSYASTPEVAESIRTWGILTPRIASVASTIEEGEGIVVNGTLENPDIRDVRHVLIRVEALDAGGNLLATTEVRVRPKVIPGGSRAEFTARFKGVDPTAVLRTRASVVAWESEVGRSG